MTKKTYSAQLAKEAIKKLNKKSENNLNFILEDAIAELKVGKNLVDFEIKDYFELMEIDQEFTSGEFNPSELKVKLLMLCEKIINKTY